MKILNFFILLFVIFGWTDTAYSQAPASPAWGYDKSSKVSLRKCFSAKFFGQRIKKCVNPGSVGAGVKGSASIVTFTNADDGEVGAVLILQHNYHIEMFGQKATIGATCTFNSTKSSSIEFEIGHSLSTPPIPSISVLDILNAAVAAKKKAAKEVMRGVTPTAKRKGGKFSSGYAGALKNSAFRALLSEAASGCSLRYPDYKLFRGVPKVDLYKVGISFMAGAANWKFFRDGGASTTLKMAMTPKAKLGGNKISFKVAGQRVRWKLPSHRFKKNISLVSHKITLISRAEAARKFKNKVFKKGGNPVGGRTGGVAGPSKRLKNIGSN